MNACNTFLDMFLNTLYDLDFFFLIVDLVVSLLKNIPTFLEMNQS